jgi:hypothetical protein
MSLARERREVFEGLRNNLKWIRRNERMGTHGYTRQHGLTISQQNAIDLLVTGANDTETAETVGVNRVTVSKWRLYDPWFQAELNSRRAELWGATKRQLQALVPKAIEALAQELTEGENRWKAALEVLKLAGLSPTTFEVGATDSDQIINNLVEQRIAAKRAEQRKHLSEIDQRMAETKSPAPSEYEAEARVAREEVLAEIEANCTVEPD